MITECNTQEEYKKRISELRKERDNLRRRADEIDKEMDALKVDSKVVDFIVGNFIVIDRTHRGGYKTYFHVNTWKNEPRGVRLYGKGFSTGVKHNLRLDESYTLYWEDFTQPIEITEEEFYKTFDKEVKKIRKSLEDFGKYETFPDICKLKSDLREGNVEITWDDRVLKASSISKAINLDTDEVS